MILTSYKQISNDQFLLISGERQYLAEVRGAAHELFLKTRGFPNNFMFPNPNSGAVHSLVKNVQGASSEYGIFPYCQDVDTICEVLNAIIYYNQTGKIYQPSFNLMP